MANQGDWYGNHRHFGLHYDLHANAADTTLGTRCDADALTAAFERMGAEFVQTDCKGHPGYTSWFSEVEHASVPDGLTHDALACWREATRRLGLPLHCHYSGIWDGAAAAKNPHWVVTPVKPVEQQGELKQNAGGFAHEVMCPRGGYLEEFMIPQMKELVDRYDVDGFWIDGDLWAAQPCYCDRCRAAYREQTGKPEPPAEPTDPDWPTWWKFTLDSFEAYVTRYVEAVHGHRPGVKVCSNWLQTFGHPGEPRVPTDWISGDNVWAWSLDSGRCECRFISTRGKPWDLMLWNFYYAQRFNKKEYPPVAKPAQMLMQEAATVVALGGGVQVYETVPGVRDGRLSGWRADRIGEVGRFVKRRRKLCRGSDAFPQIAVLHSEHALWASANGPNLKHGVDLRPVQAAVITLVESQLPVDVLDEWALRPRLSDFPLVVVPEAHRMSDGMLEDLKAYVETGGRLLVTGVDAFDRFGGAFLGVAEGKVAEAQDLAVSGGGGASPLYLERVRLTTVNDATVLSPLYRDVLLDEDSATTHPAAVLRRVGKGAVAYVPWDVFTVFTGLRYPELRAFVAEVVRELADKRLAAVQGPACVDVVMRRRKNIPLMVHLINNASGLLLQPNVPAVDEIPRVGPIRLRVPLPAKPRSVISAYDREPIDWSWTRGTLRITVPSVHIHNTIVVRG